MAASCKCLQQFFFVFFFAFCKTVHDMKSTAFITLFAFLSVPASYAQDRPANTNKTIFNVRSNYTKFEYHVPMRDGVKLFTSVYAPKDASRPVSDPHDCGRLIR
jgi:hypothetical protein